mmetsp:Transcript_15259/g.35173  ORF Transcript_15259/g.35173 Transcript_15259/m.35173 type:complete len:97 (-) Transcript_15259:38-328(-)
MVGLIIDSLFIHSFIRSQQTGSRVRTVPAVLASGDFWEDLGWERMSVPCRNATQRTRSKPHDAKRQQSTMAVSTLGLQGRVTPNPNLSKTNSRQTT